MSTGAGCLQEHGLQDLKEIASHGSMTLTAEKQQRLLEKQVPDTSGEVQEQKRSLVPKEEQDEAACGSLC